MSVHIQSVDTDVWDTFVNARYQPQIVADGKDGVVLDKPKADWNDDDKKKVEYDLKAENILISSLGVNEYHSFSHCKTAKCGMHWKPFMKKSMMLNNKKINTLVQ
jgi:hypothetical protein